MANSSLTRYAWISIAAALVTIGLKLTAYYVTGSIGLFSDALESLVNLAAAIIALFMLRIAEKPPDDDHMYGHTKAEYFSSVLEGVFIIIAAVSIGYSAIGRIMHPMPLEQTGLGMTISAIAAIINGLVAMQLLRAGKKFHSITLESDAHHLLTDVWTSAAVIGGISLVAITHIHVIDPLIALFVAANIVYTGYSIISKSVLGLLDSAIDTKELEKIKIILNTYCTTDITYHDLRTRQSASRKFISFHILVPGTWTIKEGHDLLERIEKNIRDSIINATIFTHLEPIDDPRSMEDTTIDRH